MGFVLSFVSFVIGFGFGLGFDSWLDPVGHRYPHFPGVKD